MNMQFAMDKAGGREELARLLGVAAITTYHWDLDKPLPKKHLRFLSVARPKWVREWERQQTAKAAAPQP